jgi:hypothetical protein
MHLTGGMSHTVQLPRLNAKSMNILQTQAGVCVAFTNTNQFLNSTVNLRNFVWEKTSDIAICYVCN